MRFSTIVFSGVLAALSVSAQNATSAVVSGTAPVTPAQSSQAACLSACAATDPKCRDACIVDPTGVPNPAIACINACVQGNGTAADNAAYETCQRNCRLSSAVLVTSTPAPTGAATKSGSDATATGSGSTGSQTSGAAKPAGTSTGADGVATGSPTASGSGASGASASSTAKSDGVRVGVTVAGVLSAFVAVLAL